MNRKELIEAMAKDAGLTKTESEKALVAFMENVKKSLKKGNKVSLVGFGTFERRQRAARNGINPLTGKALKIPATKVPAFKAGKTLKDFVK